MRRILLTALLAVPMLTLADRGATEAWVANYVSNYVHKSASEMQGRVKTGISSNGWVTAELDGVTISFPQNTERAFWCYQQTDLSASFGITNRMVFALDTTGTNAVWRHHGIVFGCSQTNMWYDAPNGVRYSSRLIDRYIWLVSPAGQRLGSFCGLKISPQYKALLLQHEESENWIEATIGH